MPGALQTLVMTFGIWPFLQAALVVWKERKYRMEGYAHGSPVRVSGSC